MKKNLQINIKRVAVLGGGSWATALVKVLCHTQTQVGWYIRDVDNKEYIKKYGHNRHYLRSAMLDVDKLHIDNNIEQVVKGADVVIVAIPSAYFLSEFSKVNIALDDKILISAVKGFVTDEHLTVAEYFNKIHNVPFDKIGVITGPCHAEEVASERLSYMTIGSKYIEVAEELCGLLRTKYLRTIPSTDIYGLEYAAALKNIYAIGAGIASGLGYGDNFLSVLIANSFREMANYINSTYSTEDRHTDRSAYLGDLLVTCYSQFSRNRTFGTMIGKGYDVLNAQLEMKMIAEGYYACQALEHINSIHKVDMPIASAVYKILYEGASASNTFRRVLFSLL